MSCACGVQCERPCNAEPGSVCEDCQCRRDDEHRAELLKLQDDLLQGANREVMAEALIERLRGELGEARGLVREIRHCSGACYVCSVHGDAARVAGAVPPPAESTPVCTACPGPALLGACSHPGCEVNKESREVGRMMRENDKDGLATYLNRNVAAKAKRAVERINAAETKHVLGMIRNPPPPTDALKAAMARTPPAPPDDIRERLAAFEIRLAQLQAGIAALEAKGEPGTHANDICARPKCLSPRHYNIHDPERGGHVFVEPAPQPAPSGDEAKVREILDRTGWFFEVPRDKAQLVGHDEVLGLLHEAYAAGKADGARAEREACGKVVRGKAAEQREHAYRITFLGGRWARLRMAKECDEIADAIARRGSEGK